jgi:hypothetical protein
MTRLFFWWQAGLTNPGRGHAFMISVTMIKERKIKKTFSALTGTIFWYSIVGNIDILPALLYHHES